MVPIELIYELGCPNLDAARAGLREALGDLGLPPQWTEWERSDPDSPWYARRYGSPTILIEGVDVAGCHPEEEAASCRVYQAPGGLSGAPPVEAIWRALRRHASRP